MRVLIINKFLCRTAYSVWIFQNGSLHALLETNGLAVEKDHQFKGRYDAEKNAVVISLEENEFENERQSKIGLSL